MSITYHSDGNFLYEPIDPLGVEDDPNVDWSQDYTDKYGRTWEQASGRSIGTCAGCGDYGTLGKIHVRNGEECGEYL